MKPQASDQATRELKGARDARAANGEAGGKADATEIDLACDRFVAASRNGEVPRIEDFVAGWQEPEFSKLLNELLELELRFASNVGRIANPDDYLPRFPRHQHLIADVFDRFWKTVTADTKCGVNDTLANATAQTLVMQSQFTGFRIHAKGGLGVIYRANDAELGREVAVKFIRPDAAENLDSRQQFHLEAEVTSQLGHPGVVPLYGVGTSADGTPFYAMRFIEGETLDAALKRFHATRRNKGFARDQEYREMRELLTRFIAVCQTIAYAHNRGVIHRDIKPENVMLGRYGETLVIDWGLAQPVDREGVFKLSGEPSLRPTSGSHSSKRDGAAAGTPAYMSPEQIGGQTDLSPATDIYSLGATLFKILVGRAPFSGNVAQIQTDVRAGNFVRPHAADRRLPRPLDAICVMAMHRHPEQRYATALDLARDVESYLADAPVTAYRAPVSVRCARWARRNRVLSQSILVALFAIALAGGAAALVLGQLRSGAVQAGNRERELRRQNLMSTARFAARTIANSMDIRLRILEQAALDPELRRLVSESSLANASPDPQSPLQQWIDSQASKYHEVEARAWFLCAADGTQVARSPSHNRAGELASSYGHNFAYRDYFHGKGMDYLGAEVSENPLTHPNISVALESTNESELMMSFSVPVRDEANERTIGVLGMSVVLGSFAEIDIALPQGQIVMLVDTRSYLLQRGTSEKESGQGLILQHPSLDDPRQWRNLPRLSDSMVHQLRHAEIATAPADADHSAENLLPPEYHDPLAAPGDGPWLAAFAPVLLTSRPASAKVHNTGCFVIVQQLDRPDGANIPAAVNPPTSEGRAKLTPQSGR